MYGEIVGHNRSRFITLFISITMLRGTDNIPWNIPWYFPHSGCGTQCLGSFWGLVVGQNPSDSKSNRLHVDIFQTCFIHLRHILQIPLKRSVNFLKCWTSTGYSSNSTDSFFSPFSFETEGRQTSAKAHVAEDDHLASIKSSIVVNRLICN
jgi:hypothetical protein